MFESLSLKLFYVTMDIELFASYHYQIRYVMWAENFINI